LPAAIRKTPPSPDGQLPQWSGSLLDESNRGAFLQPNDELCIIGEPGKYEAVLAVDQADLESIRPGQRVRVKLDAYAGDVMETTIESAEDIAREPMKYSSQSMSLQTGGILPTKTDASGASRPLSATYQVTVPLPGDGEIYKTGQRGRAKVSADSISLGHRFWKFLTRTFHFEL
jgi:hypothetical protein